MPNYCTNYIMINHHDPKMIGRFMKAFFIKKELFNEFIPEPQSNNDYHWYINNWGTTEDVGGEPTDPNENYDDCQETYFEQEFDTRWSPPIEFYKFMEEQLNFQIKALYVETGNNFYGVYENGVDTSNEFTELIKNPNTEICSDLEMFFENVIGDDWRECMDDWDIGQDDDDDEQEQEQDEIMTEEELQQFLTEQPQEEDTSSQYDILFS